MSEKRSHYQEMTQEMLGKLPPSEAMNLAVGGDFDTVGELEFQLLRAYGLNPRSNVVDVGCGSGRLAKRLGGFLEGPYIGVDIVPEMLAYARDLVQRDDWLFVHGDGAGIPVSDAHADFVVFFSVFTHLMDEACYRYLSEAARILKPNGLIMVSFLEYQVAEHWGIFGHSLTYGVDSGITNRFIGRDAFIAWAEHLDLRVIHWLPGDQRLIPLSKPVQWDDGRAMTDYGSLGQSVVVLGKNDLTEFPINQHFPDLTSLSSPPPPPTPKIEEVKLEERADYKKTWERLAESSEDAKMAVAGYVDEANLALTAQRTLEILEKQVGVNDDDVILEIGCGVGRVGSVLCGRCHKWIGSDISGKMLGHARQRLRDHDNAEFVELSGDGLREIPDESVTLVYSTVVFMHLYEWDRYRYVEEAFRVLKPGGRCFFDNIDLTSPHGKKMFDEAKSYSLEQRPARIAMSSTRDELATYAMWSGFRHVRLHHWDDAWISVTGVK